MKKFLVLLCSIFVIAAMFTSGEYTYEAHALTEEEAAWVEEAHLALQEILEEREVMALVYLTDEYAVRSEASEDSSEVVTVYSGHTVFVQDVVLDDNYEAWVKVTLYNGGTEYEGYISRRNLAFADQRFLNWEAGYGMGEVEAPKFLSAEGDATETISDEEVANRKAEEIAQFPESYREALTALSENHPNWTFVPQKTNLNWHTVVANELKEDRSLIYTTFPDYAKGEPYDDQGWYYATEAALEEYLDPRNGLTENAIFQFEQLTYNEEYHTREAIREFLKGTFMENDGTDATRAPGTVMHFDKIFWAIGAEDIRQVSPFHLAARVLQEQGLKGGSALISGNYTGAGGIYKGYYNYFNVGAWGISQQMIIENGLKYAKNATFEGEPYPWNNAYASILGGSEVISANYIRKGQDTLYLQKYNVGPDAQYAHYTHQYMQNIVAPTSEAKSIKRLYESAGALDSPFVFKIPVYENMPGEEYVGNINSELKSFELKQTDSGASYLTGEIVVVEWVDGVSTVPDVAPVMTFQSTDGTESIDVFVTATGTNTYYFDRFIEGLSGDKEYVFEIASGNKKNLSPNKSMNVSIATSPNMPAEKHLGNIGNQIISYYQADNGEMRLYRDKTCYVGNINSELKKTELVKGPNGNYVSGEIVVVEWVNNVSTVPKEVPIMHFKSTDGLESLPVFVVATGTNTYYFDRSLGDMDTSKEYVFTVASGDENNVSEYRSMIVTTAAMENKEGQLWESDTQYVRYRTDANTAELRIYAVDK